MDDKIKEIIWKQLGASIDMLENAITACPEDLWGNRTKQPEFWYTAYHTLFWLDCHMSDSSHDFQPPSPFTLSEYDPDGILPERVYTKDELLSYLGYCRNKCRNKINKLSDKSTTEMFEVFTLKLNHVEQLLYNMRHVQHHAAQLNLMLRKEIDSAPRWVRQTAHDLK